MDPDLTSYNLGINAKTVAMLDFIQEKFSLPDHGAALVAAVQITHTMLTGEGTTKTVPTSRAEELGLI